MVTVDARGRGCPEPVLLTKQAHDKNPGQGIEVLVDAKVARDNVSRFLTNAGFQLAITEQGPDFIITATPRGV